jgi:aminocarboxymuconate-semialdehyde decarboxylase
MVATVPIVDLSSADVIDTHSHWRPPGYAELMREQAARDPVFAREQAPSLRSAADPQPAEVRLQAQLQDMATAGVDVSFVSLPPPAASFGEAQFALRVSRETNDALIAAAEHSEGRLKALVSLPLPAVDEAIAELERVVASPHVAGLQVLATGRLQAVAPDHAELVLARAAELGLTVVVHPSLEPLPSTYDDWMLSATLAPVVSSSLAVARLILSGLLDRLPSLTLVVPHLGGVLPYLAGRIADFGRGEAQHDFGHYLRHRLYVDTCSYHPPALRCAVETMGADRLVMGSDFPNRGSSGRAVADVTDYFVDEGERRAVLAGTARRIFGRSRGA